jgi:outer membrane protein TolC
LGLFSTAAAEPVPLKRMIDLALSHSTTGAIAEANEQHAIASYQEARAAYIPSVALGSGLGASWGFPLSLEGSAPALFNVTAQSALISPSLRQFVKAANTEIKASNLQSKDQRNQVIQDTVLSYAELAKWEQVLADLQGAESDALRLEQIEEQRIQEGVDNPLERNKARLVTARVRLRKADAEASADILRQRLSHMTGLLAASIQTVPASMPALAPNPQEDQDQVRAVGANPAVLAAEQHASAEKLRAQGEHRALWPEVDFAAQYALLSTFNNYADFFKKFERNNATVGVVIRFPFLNPIQHEHAKVADAEALKAAREAEAAKNQVSEETLRLQRSVRELEAAREVARLEYEVAKGNLDATQIRIDSGTGAIRDLEDARTQTNVRFGALQDANFELQKAQITLMRATGELEAWATGGI